MASRISSSQLKSTSLLPNPTLLAMTLSQKSLRVSGRPRAEGMGKASRPAIARSWQLLRLSRNQSLREPLKTYYMLRSGRISRNSRYKEKSFKDQRVSQESQQLPCKEKALDNNSVAFMPSSARDSTIKNTLSPMRLGNLKLAPFLER
jgi:hypothetical protein